MRTPGLVRLEEVEDEHRLQSLVDSGRLAALVLETWARRLAGIRNFLFR